MIALEDIVVEFAARELFVAPTGSVSYADFAAQVAQAKLQCRAGGLLPLPLYWNADAFARLIAALQQSIDVAVGNPEAALLTHPQLPGAEARPLLLLPSGGTSGERKWAIHSAQRFISAYAISARPPRRQLVLYAADHLAGIDAFFRALFSGSTLVLPRDRSAASICAAIEHWQVEILPATPTFLQFLLLSGELQGRDLSCVRFIPHGAEPMADALRQRIRQCFPHAQLLHRFGLTELGGLPVIEDPADPQAFFLHAEGFAWKIEHGELMLQSPRTFLGYLGHELRPEGEWYATGDLAEITPQGSFRILGRKQSVINVGGSKVFPEEVEQWLLQDPQVNDVAVHAEPHPLTGQCVVATVVFAKTADISALQRRLRARAATEKRPLAQLPYRIFAADSLPKSSTHKRLRA